MYRAILPAAETKVMATGFIWRCVFKAYFQWDSLHIYVAYWTSEKRYSVLRQTSFNFLPPALFLTAGEAGWHLHLSALRPHGRQTHHLYSGGQEPEENGRGWTVRYMHGAELQISHFIISFSHLTLFQPSQFNKNRNFDQVNVKFGWLQWDRSII